MRQAENNNTKNLQPLEVELDRYQVVDLPSLEGPALVNVFDWPFLPGLLSGDCSRWSWLVSLLSGLLTGDHSLLSGLLTGDHSRPSWLVCLLSGLVIGDFSLLFWPISLLPCLLSGDRSRPSWLLCHLFCLLNSDNSLLSFQFNGVCSLLPFMLDPPEEVLLYKLGDVGDRSLLSRLLFARYTGGSGVGWTLYSLPVFFACVHFDKSSCSASSSKRHLMTSLSKHVTTL